MPKSEYEQLFDELAKVGYEEFFDDTFDNLPKDSIERALWRNVAFQIVKRLRELYYKKGKEWTDEIV